MKKIASLIFFLSILGEVVGALTLSIANDISDIALTKNIRAYFEFGDQTQAVLCGSVTFYVDNPNVTIADFICNQRPNVQFLQNFKREKKVFTKPFSYDLKIDMEVKNQLLTIVELEKTNLYFACILIEKNGRARAIFLCKPIFDEFSMSFPFSKFGTNSLVQTNTLDTTINFFVKDKLKSLPKYKQFETESENVIIDKFKELIRFIVDRVRGAADKINFFLFYIFYLVVFVLAMFLFFLTARYSCIKKWMTELLRMLFFIWSVMTFLFLKPYLVLYKFYLGLAILLILSAFYYIFSSRSDSVTDKLKSLLGFVLAATAIPLILEAFLVFKSLS